MAPSLGTNTPLGVSIPGVPAAAPVEDVSDFERVMAKNLRQQGGAGQQWIRGLLENPAPEAEAELAKLIADSGGRAIRQNEAGMRAQLQAIAEQAELYRRAVEAVVCNAGLAPANYPPDLRAALEAAWGRAY